MRSVCIFCGSSAGNDPAFVHAARAMGEEVARRKLTLVYGGGQVGLMGVVADAALAFGGEVVGVLPAGLFRREVAHPGLTRLHTVTTMHERKALMAELADAFVALPGGYGTLDELFEMTTWAQLGIHRKPVGLLDVAGYFDALSSFIAHAMEEGFISAAHARIIIHGTSPPALLDALARRAPPAADEGEAELKG